MQDRASPMPKLASAMRGQSSLVQPANPRKHGSAGAHVVRGQLPRHPRRLHYDAATIGFVDRLDRAPQRDQQRSLFVRQLEHLAGDDVHAWSKQKIAQCAEFRFRRPGRSVRVKVKVFFKGRH